MYHIINKEIMCRKHLKNKIIAYQITFLQTPNIQITTGCLRLGASLG
jgi:hypothetical protein